MDLGDFWQKMQKNEKKMKNFSSFALKWQDGVLSLHSISRKGKNYETREAQNGLG